MNPRKDVHRELIAACEAAAPACVAPLWVTITHAPDNVLLDVAELLARETPSPDARLRALLTWLGHGHAQVEPCPICWMLVGRLVYTIPDPISRLERALTEGPEPALVGGAALFLAALLEPRHALPAGVDRAQLVAFGEAARSMRSETQGLLVSHWTLAGRDPQQLTRRLT
ncbi:MAG: hypothetical protein KDD82_24950 [Planctomycetes bacterium]|nr:hypothetical protein [Planctomycetota bacterium]